VRIPQRDVEKEDFIVNSKNKFVVPPKEIIPDSKYKEAYMKLMISQDKPFNKKVGSSQEFHEALNIKGLHEKRYGKGTFENVASSNQRSPAQSRYSNTHSRYEGN
jgi:hypothetical protein